MAHPIKPIHQLNDHSELFETNREDLSDLQQYLLGENPQRQAAKCVVNPTVIAMLEKIEKSPDEVITVAQSFHSKDKNSHAYRVPTAITDSDVLNLKVQGLVTGSGRVVSFTDKGKIALRDHWLRSDNNYRANRTKQKFDYRSASDVNHKFAQFSPQQDWDDYDSHLQTQEDSGQGGFPAFVRSHEGETNEDIAQNPIPDGMTLEEWIAREVSELAHPQNDNSNMAMAQSKKFKKVG